MLFYLQESIVFIMFILTGFIEEMMVYIFMDDGHSIRKYIDGIFEIYTTLKSHYSLRNTFKNEFNELDSVFGLCDRIDFSSEVKLSSYDMARNAMLERSCNLISSKAHGVNLHKYMDLNKDFRSLVKICKRDLVKMFVVARKISAYYSMFLLKKDVLAKGK